jgi:hypothetical protein
MNKNNDKKEIMQKKHKKKNEKWMKNYYLNGVLNFGR